MTAITADFVEPTRPNRLVRRFGALLRLQRRAWRRAQVYHQIERELPDARSREDAGVRLPTAARYGNKLVAAIAIVWRSP